MIREPTIYEQAVTTDRPAEILAERHGFESIGYLSESLSPNAKVLDVGAGASPFGVSVAARRPDITWINFDFSYHDGGILKEVAANAPSNITFVAGDATRLAEAYAPESFDTVFSYWLLPHMSIDDKEPAKSAAKAMFSITKIGGLISVGPKVRQSRAPSLRGGRAIQTVKNVGDDPTEFADRIVEATKLREPYRYMQRLSNLAATNYFGTSRYTKREGGSLKIYSPRRGEYVSPLAPSGMVALSGLYVALARQAYQQVQSRRTAT